MDKVFHCHSSLSDLPDLGEKLVGTDCGSFHFRCLHYQENPLVILEEVKEPDCPKRNELGRCHRFRFGSSIFREHLYLSELSDPILLTGKSLLVGDFLYVSKMSYGPRVPNTPLSMPLAQHTLPILNTKSYIEWPQWKYKRVPGFGKVKLNDIVVFNFPAGDTVALNFPDADFYTLAYNIGKQIYPNPINMDSLTREQQKTVYDLYYNAGRKEIMSNPQRYGKVVTRPVDRRENYVKRCVGLPGDTLQIINGQVMIDGKAIENPENLQFNYFVQTTGPYITEEMFRELGISKADQGLTPEGAGYEEGLVELGMDGRNAQGRLNPVYHLPLTKKCMILCPPTKS